MGSNTTKFILIEKLIQTLEISLLRKRIELINQ